MKRPLKTTVPNIGKRALIDRKSWTVVVRPGQPTILGRNLYPGIMVMRNHGPGVLEVRGGHPQDDAILGPGDTRLIPIRNTIDLLVYDPKPVKLEFDLVLVIN